MKYTIVNGSARSQSQSLKVAQFIEQALRSKIDAQSYLLDLTGNPLPIWDEGVWKGAEPWKKTWDPMKLELQSSDAFIFVVPEWNGMVPAARCGGRGLANLREKRISARRWPAHHSGGFRCAA